MLLWILFKYVVIVGVVALLAAFALACCYLYREHAKLSHLPGPKRTSFFFGNLSEMSEKEPLAIKAAAMHTEYGPVFVLFFLHQAFIFITDPSTVKSVLMNNAHVKPSSYSFFSTLYGIRFMGSGLVTETDHDKWNVHRRMFNPAFHRKHLMELTGIFNESSDKMVTRLRQYADSGVAIPLMETINRVTLDVIAKAGFGIQQELILEDTPFVGYVVTSFQGLLEQMRSPMAWMKLSQWKRRKEVQHAAQSLRDTGKKLIIEARQAQLEKRDQKVNILSNIMKFLEDEDLFDLETMIDHFVTFFVAGQDTTASLLTFAIVEIGRHPEVMERVREEIDTVMADKTSLNYDDVLKMEYTLRVLKETLRLYPPAAGTSRKLGHDITVCGYDIAAGNTVQFTHTASSRMEEYFKNPLTFDPDRFLRDDDKPLYAYYPFSLGARSCIGQQFALIEVRIILAKLYKNFDLKLDPSQSFDIFEQITLKPKGMCTNWIYTRQK